MSRFNLSDWALNHRSFVWFLMIISTIFGVIAYGQLGREEDPSFAIKTVVISASLPGATVEETMTQVTDRIESKLKDLPEYDKTRSMTRAGLAVIYLELKPTTRADDLRRVFQNVRNLMSDLRSKFPQEFQGLLVNDTFGDVFGNIYAFTSDGFTPREVQDAVRGVQRQVQGLADAGKVDLFGTRDEVIYLEFSTDRLAALGLSQAQVLGTLQAQNAIIPSGVIDTGAERLAVRVGGQFQGAESLRDVNLRVGDRFFRLTDVADIRRDYVDPPTELFRFDGKEAVGLAIGMRAGANVITFGTEIDRVIAEAEARLPLGVSIHKVADQPHVVDESVQHFVRALIEAVAIVLAVSFVSLGMRAGLVVTVTIPLVLAITFVVMQIWGITLQRISLGALIIALGLLVDDAMIAIETMITRLEKGESLTKAASFAWTSIAFPMLSGTLVTVAGFIPIGLNSSAAGEFVFSLFFVIAVSLLVSWIVAVLFAPLLGVTLLPARMKQHDGHGSRYARLFHQVLVGAIRRKWMVIGTTVGFFILAVLGLTQVENQFFPDSDRTELIVDVTLPQNAAIGETGRVIARLEAALDGDPDQLFYSTYVGRGAPRFILSFEGPTAAANVGQIIIQTPDLAARDRLRAKLTGLAATEFPGADILIKLQEIGPPVGRPVQYRLSGPDSAVLADQGRALAAVMGSDPRLGQIVSDWGEPGRVIRVQILQDKARQLGVTALDIADALNTVYSGKTVTQLRDDIYLINIVTRGDRTSRGSIDGLEGLRVEAPGGGGIPLSSIATLSYDLETPVIQSRNRMPTITLKAAIIGKDQPATVVKALAPAIKALEASLPPGYAITVGGTVENSAQSQGPIAAVVPLMLLIMLTLVMMQMQGFRRAFVVLCAAPLGLIGVVAAMLPTGTPMGFVAILGVLALIGILVRNSIILVHEIEEQRSAGLTGWDAVVVASESRARPILLTAAAASLALIPISRQVFWGPMAVAMMGGIIVGTIITLLFVPALYAAVFRLTPPEGPEAATDTGGGEDETPIVTGPASS